MYVRPPRLDPHSGKWVVTITQSKHVFSKVVETMQFDDREPAYQAYQRTMKALGHGL